MQTQTHAIERRNITLGVQSSNAGTVTGFAIRYQSESRDLGGFREIIQRGALSGSLADPGIDPIALWNHEPRLILGRRSAGTLRLTDTAEGLAFEIDLPKTGYGLDVRKLVERGDLKSMSFGFTVAPGGEKWATRDGQKIRTLSAITLHEISLVSDPAYLETSVKMRASARERFLALRRWRASSGKA